MSRDWMCEHNGATRSVREPVDDLEVEKRDFQELAIICMGYANLTSEYFLIAQQPVMYSLQRILRISANRELRCNS